MNSIFKKNQYKSWTAINNKNKIKKQSVLTVFNRSKTFKSINIVKFISSVMKSVLKYKRNY